MSPASSRPSIRSMTSRTPRPESWRLKNDEGDATSIRVFADDEILLNMSVWESMDALKLYLYRSGHKDVLRRRRADRFDGVQAAMWWIRAGTLPDPTDAVARLASLGRLGPTDYAFTFQSTLDAPSH
jgi:hypothetical protein